VVAAYGLAYGVLALMIYGLVHGPVHTPGGPLGRGGGNTNKPHEQPNGLDHDSFTKGIVPWPQQSSSGVADFIKEQNATYYHLDKWWWRDPDTGGVYGPFENRHEARSYGLFIRYNKRARS
jgi:hypothetical protein